MRTWPAWSIIFALIGCLPGQNFDWHNTIYNSDSLQMIPDTCHFEGRNYTIEAELWRDYMPTVPYHNDNPDLLVSIVVEGCDTLHVEPPVHGGMVWLVDSAGVAIAASLEPKYHSSDYISFGNSGETVWPVGTKVDVVAEMTFLEAKTRKPYLLKFCKRDVEISMAR